jgi:hypothetical protein
MPRTNEEANDTPAATDRQNPPTASEPSYGGSRGQQQPSEGDERRDRVGPSGYRPGQEPPRVVEANPRPVR